MIVNVLKSFFLINSFQSQLESNSNSLILSQNDSNENIKSYQEVIDRWLSYVQQTIGDGVPIFIAGNKIDLVNEESVINQFKFTENGNLVENNNFPVFKVIKFLFFNRFSCIVFIYKKCLTFSVNILFY